jgi:Mg-chelatase subunit ChlD
MITVLVLLPFLFILSAMAVNLAYIQAVRTKTQIVTDAAARAAGATYVQTEDEGLALLAAQEMAGLNPIESSVLSIDGGDIEFGLSQRSSHDQPYTFTAVPSGNAARLTTNSFAAGAGVALRPVFPIFGQNQEIRPRCTATHAQATLDVAVIVDRSGSMSYAADEQSSGGPAAAPDGWSFGDAVPPNSRWLDLVASVNGFCDELAATAKLEKVALVGYASSATTHHVLTDDYALIENELLAISSEFHGGRTAVGDGILESLYTVTHPSYCRSWATKAIVLMSDGNHNEGTDPIVAAEDAVAKQIPIYTVSFSNEANQTLMKKIAHMTGGTHYHAVDAAQLNDAFRKIARRLPSMLTE